MKQFIFSLLGVIFLLSCQSQNEKKASVTNQSKEKQIMTTNFHDFTISNLMGDSTIDFQRFKGKKVLIVNVASKCGYTNQYADLQALQEKYADKLIVLGFPCNQFMGQEPGSNAEIATFCSSTYGVTFPMTEKIDVKGKDQHPIYAWLTNKNLNQLGDFKVSWNFNKFLIDEEGKLIAHFDSGTKPLSEEILKLLN